MCGDGLKCQTSSYRFVEWSVCESCKSEEFSEFLLFLGDIEMFETNLKSNFVLYLRICE